MNQHESDVVADQQSRAEGWRPDPWGAAEMRWWDGAEWSSLVVSPGRAGARSRPHHDVPANTVWIWLIVLLPLVPAVLSVFFFDPVSEAQLLFFASDAEFHAALFQPGPVDAVGLAVSVVTIVFAYVDGRTLRDRGVDRPFGWGWSFFALILTNAVYVIGRGVVLRRQTARGLAPVWAWIAVTAIAILVQVALFAQAFGVLLSSPGADIPA